MKKQNTKPVENSAATAFIASLSVETEDLFDSLDTECQIQEVEKEIALSMFDGKEPSGARSAIGVLHSFSNRQDMLDEAEERDLLARAKNQDQGAIDRLVKTHMRLVMAEARKWRGYGSGDEEQDLIQEGCLGLLKAIERFDMERPVRFSTLARIWASSYIKEFVISNQPVSSFAAAKPKRKLFFNLKKIRRELRKTNYRPEESPLSADEVRIIAERLNVRESDVIEMELRLETEFVSQIHASTGHATGGGMVNVFEFLADSSMEPSTLLEQLQSHRIENMALGECLDALSERSRKILEDRWINTDEAGNGKTLLELSEELGVSAERIRQLEVQAIKAIRNKLSVVASV